MKKLTTHDIEQALHSFFRHKHHASVFNCSRFGHECDFLAFSFKREVTEVEIKIDLGGVVHDLKKEHGHNSSRIKYLYFAVPGDITQKAILHIPERAGLIGVGRSNRASHKGYYAYIVKKAKENPDFIAPDYETIWWCLRDFTAKFMRLKKKYADIKSQIKL